MQSGKSSGSLKFKLDTLYIALKSPDVEFFLLDDNLPASFVHPIL